MRPNSVESLPQVSSEPRLFHVHPITVPCVRGLQVVWLDAMLVICSKPPCCGLLSQNMPVSLFFSPPHPLPTETLTNGDKAQNKEFFKDQSEAAGDESRPKDVQRERREEHREQQNDINYHCYGLYGSI